MTEAPEAHSTPTIMDGYVYVLSQSWNSLIAFYQPNGTLAWKQMVPVSNLTTITGKVFGWSLALCRRGCRVHFSR